ncbi:MAG: response regulator [Pirellulaceae bacterium]
MRRAGLEVSEAENGVEAVHRVEEGTFDLVLMDMQMPVMDGYAATRRLREQGHSVPIVALTANAMQGDEDECRKAGCSHFLAKPIDIDRLFTLLAETLGTLERSETAVVSSFSLDAPELQVIVEKFVGTFFVRLRDMLADFSRHDHQALADQAHWLKGASGTVGFHELVEPAKRLESFAKSGATDEIAAILQELIGLAEAIRLGVLRDRTEEDVACTTH